MMGGSPPLIAAAVVLLTVILPSVKAGTCGSGTDVITFSFNEVSGIQGVVDISISDRPQYTDLLIPSDIDDLEVKIEGDSQSQYDAGLEPNNTFSWTFQQDGLKGAGYYATMLKGTDRDGATPFSFDDRNSVQYRVACKIRGASTTTYRVLRITINDLNDNPPVFIGGSNYGANVSELASEDTVVIDSIQTSDLDNSNNKVVEYQLRVDPASPDSATGQFVLSSQDSARIVVNKHLDFDRLRAEGKPPYVLLDVIATDNGNPPMSSTATVNVTIVDADDLGPNFIYGSCERLGLNPCFNAKYTAQIPSDSFQQTGTFLQFLPVPRLPGNPDQTVILKATDRDSLDAVLVCSIEQTVPAGYEDRFEVTTTFLGSAEYQCNVRVRQSINRGDIAKLEVYIAAIEQTDNRYTERAEIELEITPTNVNPPTLGSNGVNFVSYIREDAPKGTPVYTASDLLDIFKLTVTDGDVSAADTPGRYEITLNPASMFDVNADGQVILQQAPLDYETRQNYIIDATVRELDTAEGLSSVHRLTINVLDVNDNAPTVPSKELFHTVIEGNYGPVGAVGEFIVDLQASDPDGTTLNYAIDGIKDLTGTRPDGDIEQLFRLDGGSVILQGQVSAEEQYVVTVTVSDSGQPPLSTGVVVIVTVQRAGNQPPQFTARNYTIYVSEGVQLQSNLWSIPASDPAGDDLTYAITSSSPDTNVFNILDRPNDYGILRNTVLLDRERVPRYELVIQVSEISGNDASATVTVIVTDINDNSPDFLSDNYEFVIQENEPIGKSVGKVSANDGDEPGTAFSAVGYSMLLSNNDFQIRQDTGEITSRKSFNRELQDTYQFTVLATDGGGNTGVASVIVRVTDVQDTVPLFEKKDYSFFVNEQEIVDVGSVVAHDGDSVRNVVYRFDAGEFNLFSISPTTGLIKTTQFLDYNVKNSYVFTVTTSDGLNSNEFLATSTVTVSVRDINNHIPVLTLTPPGPVTLMETDPVGTLVLNADATDADKPNTENSRIIYSIPAVDPPEGASYFYIRSDNGAMVVAAPLTSGDRSYIVTVRASDAGTNPGQLFTEKDITVQIRGNNAPYFTESSTTLPSVNSDQTGWSYVALARDDDTEPEFQVQSYRLTGDRTAMQFFQVNEERNANGELTGRVVIKKPLQDDPDLNTVYTLEVLATDGGGKTALQTITLPVNRNLMKPNLPALTYAANINENFALATSILTISATDTDQGQWGELSYTILNDGTDTAGYFYIEPTSTGGELRLKRSLVNSGRDVYTFNVEVQDGGGVIADSPATITVNVARNSQPPIFFNNTYEVTIYENATVGSSVIRVSAGDSDPNSNFNQVSYTILNDYDKGSENYFRMLDNPEGQIVVRSDLTQTSTDLFLVQVLAEDNGNPPKQAYALVIVHVLRNFHTPEWRDPFYATTVNENEALGSVFFTVTVDDRDQTEPNNLVDCMLEGDNKALTYFEVRNTGNTNGVNTCGISIKSHLYNDQDLPTQYSLVIRGKDGGTTPKVSRELPVTVTVRRNQFPPVFQNEPYQRLVDTPVTESTVLLRVTASDADISPFNRVSYKIHPSIGVQNMFTVNDIGEIKLNTGATLDGTQTLYTVSDCK